MISATAPRTVSARIRHLYLAIAFGLVIGMIPIGIGTGTADAAATSFTQGVSGYTGTVDTWLDGTSPSSDFGGSATADLVSTDPEYVLIRFESIVGNGPGQIPAGSSITGATLIVHNASNPSSGTLSLHRMLTAWSSSSTYNSMGAGVQTDDVEAAASPDASTSTNVNVSNAAITFSSLQAAVQSWVDGSPNHGWLLRLDSSDDWSMHLSEASSSGVRPTLSVTYDPPSPSIVIVNSTGDASDNSPGDDVCDTGGTVGSDPQCTLRAAIEEANASATVDTVNFAIPTADGGHASGLWTINPGTALPSISSTVTLDARTQTGWTADPVVALHGASTAAATGLTVSGTADGSIVAGLRVVGFDVDGVFVASGADGVSILDNWIGSDGSGSDLLGNGDDGIDLNGINAVIDGNVVNHNTDEGIDVRASGATITGNIIGLEADGTSGTGNGDLGIAVFSDNTTIGGSSAAERNVISANFEGIEINSSNNTVQGNYIGTDATGSLPTGNDSDDGVEIQSGTGNLVGGTAAGEGNLIAYNQLDGVRLAGGSDNAVVGNTIYGNGGLGINLGTDGVTANDGGDADTGANDLLNFPVITSAVALGGNVTVTFDLDVPAGTYRVEFFANTAADGSGYGEGETFLGSVDVSAGTSLTHVVSGVAGDIITTTATESLGGGIYGSTSEFSASSTATASSHSEPMAVWRRSGQSTPYSSGWDGSTFGVTQTSASVGDFRIVQGAESPTRDEAIVVGVDSGGTIAGEIWDGSSWTALPSLGTTSQTYWWGFDVAYEPVSGDAVVVYADGTALNYRVWNGSTWSAEGSIPEPPGGTPRQMQLAAHPFSDEMVLIVSNDSSQDYAVVWDGAVWGNGLTLDSDGTGNDRTDVYVAYEQLSGRALVVWGSGNDDVHFRVWDAGWSIEFVTPGIGGGYARWITLGSDPAGDNIAMGVLTNDADVWLSVWNGTGWVNQSTVTTSTTGTTEPAVAVAFEGTSGQAIAAYGESVSTPRFRTWDSGTGWSAESSAPSIGATSNSMMLYPEPGTDGVMLVVQDTSSDLHYLYWDGTVWGVDNELETSTGETKNQPFLFLWNAASVGPTPPAAADDSASTPVDTSVVVDVLGNDTDPNGDTLTVQSVTQGSNGSVVNNGTDVTYTPNASWSGIDTFTYTASDGNGGTDTATVTVTVEPPGPVTVSFQDGTAGYSGTVDTWVSGSFADQDNSADPLIQIDNSAYQQGLIRFDGIVGPDTGQIPTDATILSAELTFVAADPSDASATLSVHRVLRTWVETDTWNTLSSGIGIDDSEASLATDSTLGSGLDLTGTPLTITGLGPAVQAWVDGSANNGWLLVIDSSNGWDARSSENTTVNWRPKLDVTYAVGPLMLEVNSTSDSGDTNPGDAVCDTGFNNSQGDPQCTLRAAIEEANAFAGADNITFSMPATESGHSGGVWTISPGSAYPTITEAVSIDATTQTGFATTPVVELNGTGAGASSDGLRVFSPNVEIRGLAINRFGADGIEVDTTSTGGVVIAGNHLGLDPSGLVDRGNGGKGIDLQTGSGPTTVGGTVAADRNVISGNGLEGIIVWGSDGNTIVGNYIGTDLTGNAPIPNTNDGLHVGNGADNNIFGQVGAGNVISGNGDDGIEIDDVSGGNLIHGNTLGLGADGTTVVPNGRYGVVLYNGANTTQIGGSGAGEGNVISGNVSAGVVIDGNANGSTAGNVITGNLIGTDSTGTLDRGNGTYGVYLFAGAVNTAIGGTATGAGNTISGNGSHGIFIEDAGTVGTLIEGNLIGLTQAGDAPLGNTGNGIEIDWEVPNQTIGGSALGAGNVISGNLNGIHSLWANDMIIEGNIVGLDVTGTVDLGNTAAGIRVGGDNVVIGGTTAGARNVVSGNGNAGIMLDSATSAVLQGNYIGTDITGLLDRGNSSNGVYVSGTGNQIGGSVAGAGNLISGNTNDGVQTSGGSTGTVFEGNTIGLGSDGSTPIPNSYRGISIYGTGTRVGGTNPAASNTISGNFAGVVVVTGASDAAILGNAIYGNGSLGIDLANNGVTANDAGDGDSGANDLLNFPVITSASESGGTVTVEFDLDVPAGNYRVEFFTNPSGADGSGYGEGESFVSSVVVTAGSGLSHTFGGTIGDVLTATATHDLGAGSYGDTSEFSAAVTVVGTVPVAVDDSSTTAEDTAVIIDVVANDTDPNGDSLLVDTFTQGSNGSVTDNGDGTVTYTPSADFNGSDSFTYSATDGTNISNTATVTVTVTAVNDAPVANDDSATTDEDTPVVIGLLANDTDIDGDPLSFVSVSNGANGSVVDNGDGTVTYTPNADWFGTDSFVYSVTDGTDNSNIATVTVTVNPVNDDPPVAVGDNATTAEDTAVVIALVANDTDPDGDSLLVGSIVQPAFGAVVDNGNGTVTYTPNADYNGTESFTYTATDGTNSSNSATVWVTVTPVNDIPVAVADSASTTEDTAVIISVLANDTDVDGDTLSIDSFTQPTNGTVTDNGDGTLTYTPDADYSGADSFTYIASDGTATSNSATVTMTVTAVNDVPVAADDSVSTPEDTALTIAPLANDSDPEGDTLSIDSFTQPTNGTVTDNGDGTLTYTPDADYFGSDSFTYVATDGTDTSNSATVTVTVTSVNDAPVAVDDSVTTAEDTAVVIDLLANDTDIEGDSLSIQGIGQPSNGTVVDNGDGTVTYTPDADFAGADPFTYSITDGSDPSNVATVNVTVTAVNDVPVAVGDVVTTNEDTAAVVAVLANDTDTEGDTLSIDSFTQPTNGTVTDNGDGTLTYTPNPDFSGSDSFTYVATDGTDQSNSATVTVTVNAVNDAPVANDDSATTDEDTAVVIDLLANDTDTEGDTLSIQGIGQPSNGTVVDNGDGTVTYTPDPGFNGSDPFTYSSTDGTDPSNVATVGVTVTPVNDVPVANDDSATTDEDTAVVIDVVANDTDSDGDALLVDTFGQGSNGTVVDNGDGTVTYTPDPDFNGTDSFTYSAMDGTDPSNSATVTVTVNAVNDAPVAVDDSASTNEDATVVIDVVANDTDIDGDPLLVNTFTQGANGTVVDNGDGTVTYTPDVDFNGTDSFTYTATDGTDTSNTATVTVTVSALNDPPVAGADTATTNEDTAVVIDLLANDTDAEGDTLSVIAVTQGANGTVFDNGDGTVTYTPDPDFNGTDSFTYTVSDGNGGDIVSPPVSVTVTPVNDAPVANDDTGFTSEDTPAAIDLVGNDVDVDGDTLTIVGLSNGANGSVSDNGDGTVTYTPNADFNGTDTFTYSVSDGTVNSNAATVTVTVNSVNDGPVSVGDTATTDEDTAVVIDLVANDTDADGDALVVDVFTQGSNGTVSDNGDGTVTYIPNADFNGLDTFSYSATDGTDTSNTVNVVVTVNAVNDAPVANGDASTTDEDTAVVIDLIGNDTDTEGDTLSIVSVSNGGNGAVVDNGDGTVTYTPNADFNGTDTFVYSVTDGTDNSNLATVTVAVNPLPDAPVAVDDTASTPEDTSVIIDVVANDTDADGDTLVVGTLGAASSGTVVDNGDGTVTYTPAVDFVGTATFTYAATDGSLTSNTATVTMTVTAVNDAPVAVDDAASTAEDTAVTIGVLANDTDIDGDPLSIDSFTQGANGTVTDNGDGTVTYTPDLDFNGPDSFTYVATDGTLTSNTATVTVTVTAVGDAPVATGDSATTAEDTAVVIDVVGNDSDVDGDLDPTTTSITGVPANGSAVPGPFPGSITYTPDPDFNGSDSFTYEICDATALCDTAVVSVTVTAANDAPVASDDSVSTLEDTAAVVSVLTNDSDVDGDPLSVDSFTQGANGTVTDNGDGTLTYTPDLDYNGTDTFTYIATDGALVSNSATVTVTVGVVNDAPVAVDDAAATSEDTAVTFDVVGNDTDVDGDPLSVATVGAAANGTVSDNGDGTLTYTPDADFNGIDSFTYTVTDGTDTSNTATVAVTVIAVNDAPVAADDTGTTAEDAAITIDLLGNDSDIDGEPLSVATVGAAANGSVVDNGDGTVTYTPNPDFNGTDSFTYTASDGTTTSNTASVTVTVTAVNDAPVAADDTLVTDEDTAATVDLVGNDSDADGDLLSVATVGAAANGTVVDNGDGTVTYTPNLDFNGVDMFTYTLTDGTDTSNVATVTATVTAVNDAPVASDDSAVTDEDTPVTFDFLANDLDADGDPLSIDAWSPPANGSVVDNGDGTFTYAPAVDFNGSDSFTYTVTDGAATSNVATVTVTVNAVNDAPVAIDDTAATSSDRAINVDVLANDVDLDDDPLTVVGVGAATGGIATDNGDGTIRFNPSAGFSGDATFTYTVSDGALTDTALVTISVTLANTPPVVSDVFGSIPETTSSGDSIGNVIATDPDGDGMVYTVSGDARIRVDGSGRLTLVGVVSAGDLLLGTVTVTDANGASTTASIAITVTAVNQAPVISDQAFAVDSDTGIGSSVGSISASDPDGGSLTYSAIGSSPFTVDASGRVSVAGALDSFSGDTVTFAVIVTDSDGLSAAATITVTVRGVTPTNTTAAPSTTAPPTDPTTAENRPPVAVDDVVIGSEDSPKQFNPLSNDTDADGDPLTLTWIQTPSEGEIIRESAGYRFSPARDWSGTTTGQYRISDGRGGSDIGTVTFVINPVNDAPRIQTTTEPAEVSSGGSIEIPIPTIIDPENDGYTISIGDPEHGTAEIVDGKIVYSPDPGYNGQDTIQLYVVDTAGAGSRGIIVIEVVIDGSTVSVKILDLGEIGSNPEGGGRGVLAGGPVNGGDGGGEQFVLFGIPFFGLIASEVLSATWAVRAPLIAFVVVAAVTLLATTRRSFNLAVKPLPVARPSDLTWSVVLVGEFERLPALSGPDHSHKAISWFDAGVAGIESTGKLMMTNGTLWVEVVTSAGPAWVEARHVTPGRPESSESHRASMIEVRDELYDLIRHGEPYTHLISGRGLYMQMSDEIAAVPQSRVEPLLTHILRDGDAESKQLLDALSMPLVKDTDYEVPIELRNFEYLIVGEGWNRWALYFERGTDKRPVLVGVSSARALVGA